MSLWYDIKNKVYSSGPMDNWYVTHLKKVCDSLTSAVTNIYSQHIDGLSKHHKAEHIEYDEDVTLRDALDTEISSREDADKSLLNQAQSLVNAEKAARESSDNSLLGQTNQLISQEKANRENADNNLSNQIENLINEEKVARKNALSLKVDKESGKGLSTNDYTNADKAIVSSTTGKKVANSKYYNLELQPNSEITATPTTLLCREGSEIFNDYEHNQALGLYSHAEGQFTSASGDYSHTEGVLTKANGFCAHSEGENTLATGKNQHVQGILNIEDKENKYSHIVGNGHYDTDEYGFMYPVRSNSHTLDWDGNGWYLGDVFCGNDKVGLKAHINALYNLRPAVLNEASDELVTNTIYDLGESQALTLNLPDGNIGDWIKIDFISGETPTELSINADSICDYSIIPEANTIYSLYFDWGRLSANTYGWRFAYSEYTKVV